MLYQGVLAPIASQQDRGSLLMGTAAMATGGRSRSQEVKWIARQGHQWGCPSGRRGRHQLIHHEDNTRLCRLTPVSFAGRRYHEIHDLATLQPSFLSRRPVRLSGAWRPMQPVWEVADTAPSELADAGARHVVMRCASIRGDG